MPQAIEPYRPAWVSVRRESGWWPVGLTTTRLALDGRRAGFLGGRTPKVLRVEPDVAHVVAVQLGGRWCAYAVTPAPGERVSLVCGSYRWMPGAWGVVLRRLSFRFGQFACAAAAGWTLPRLKWPLFHLWVEMPLGPIDRILYRAIEVVTWTPAAFLLGLAAWPLLALPLTRKVRADRSLWYYYRLEPAPHDGGTGPIAAADEPVLVIS
jgi:hypothetical protein